MALLTVARCIGDWVARDMAFRTTARGAAPTHLATFMAVDAGLIQVFSFELELGVLGVLRLPMAQHLPTQGLTGLVTDLTLLTQLWPSEAVNVRMATLAVLGKPEVAYSAGAQALDVTFGACHLAMMVRE
jgi:hypothetical protein